MTLVSHSLRAQAQQILREMRQPFVPRQYQSVSFPAAAQTSWEHRFSVDTQNGPFFAFGLTGEGVDVPTSRVLVTSGSRRITPQPVDRSVIIGGPNTAVNAGITRGEWPAPIVVMSPGTLQISEEVYDAANDAIVRERLNLWGIHTTERGADILLALLGELRAFGIEVPDSSSSPQERALALTEPVRVEYLHAVSGLEATDDGAKNIEVVSDRDVWFRGVSDDATAVLVTGPQLIGSPCSYLGVDLDVGRKVRVSQNGGGRTMWSFLCVGGGSA